MPGNPPRAQDRGFERELRREADAHLLLGRHRAGLVVENGVGRRRQARSMRSARARQRERALAERDVDLARDLGDERRDHARAARSPRPRTSARCAGSAATRTRAPPDSPRARAKCFCAERDQRAARIGRQAGRERLGEFADRAVDDDAAVGARPAAVSTASSGAQLENVLGVDRVGIAQPVLDVGDARARVGRASRGGVGAGFVDALHFGGRSSARAQAT